MIGAIIGDMVGSIYEFRNYKATDFEPFLSPSAHFTDDTIMSIAVADGLLNNRDPQDSLRDWGRRYWSNGGWGQRFASWLSTPDPQPYDSFGNGAAMRISAVAWLSDSYEEAMRNADRFTEISHNHPEGMKAARATVSAIWWARKGLSADEIRQRCIERILVSENVLLRVKVSYYSHLWNLFQMGALVEKILVYQDPLLQALS